MSKKDRKKEKVKSFKAQIKRQKKEHEMNEECKQKSLNNQNEEKTNSPLVEWIISIVLIVIALYIIMFLISPFRNFNYFKYMIGYKIQYVVMFMILIPMGLILFGEFGSFWGWILKIISLLVILTIILLSIVSFTNVVLGFIIDLPNVIVGNYEIIEGEITDIYEPTMKGKHYTTIYINEQPIEYVSLPSDAEIGAKVRVEFLKYSNAGRKIKRIQE